MSLSKARWLTAAVVSPSQMIDGEMYPPTVRDTQAEMLYPPHVPEHLQFSVGQEVFGLVPGLMMYATIWLREHNRVCDVLKSQHPDWDDEQLFQTSRLILIGESPCCCVQLQPACLGSGGLSSKLGWEWLLHGLSAWVVLMCSFLPALQKMELKETQINSLI